MARKTTKWKFTVLFYIIFATITKSLPIDKRIAAKSVVSVTTAFESPTLLLRNLTDENKSSTNELARSTVPRDNFPRIRPGMIVTRTNLVLNIENGRFVGRAVLHVEVTVATREDRLRFHVAGLTITSVMIGLLSEANAVTARFTMDDNEMEIRIPTYFSNSYVVIINYNGPIGNDGQALFAGSGEEYSYLAMNLHPTNARRVFPCLDELTEASTFTLTVNGLDYTNLVANSVLEADSQTQFRPLQGPSHLHGLIAHNFPIINTPVVNLVSLRGRTGLANQVDVASLAINSYLTWLNEWTQRDYFQEIVNRNEWMNVIAVPDVSIDWYSLSIVGVWEPYILMLNSHGRMQQKKALVSIAEAMSRKWFGYFIYPENWIHNWVISGLGTYAAYEAVKDLETNSNGEVDDSVLDVDAMFLTDVIQESLLYDSYPSALVLQPNEPIYDEDSIRDAISGLVKYKAPAIMALLRLTLGNENRDIIQSAARGLFISRALQTVNSFNFIDAINGEWGSVPAGEKLIEEVEDFLEPYITSNGYPVVRVLIRQGGVTLTQQHFGFSNPGSPQTFQIPITFTRSVDRNFDNIYPVMILDVNSFSHDIDIGDEEDWVIYNIQGRGYYRVNYDNDLMERLIGAMDNPDRREEIHHLNRATLVDDSLNLARGGFLTYDLAFQLVLTMEHETEYTPWKAFVRNMDFIRKRLVALVDDDEDLDPDIYLRMVQRTIGAIEGELGFEPAAQLNEPVMDSLTRGIVMDHACRAGYNPCIAAAIDWFYDPSADEPTVNPNIPHDIRPAVFCTMVREGDGEVIEALNTRLEEEPVMYERVVILESFGCSQDENFINSLLVQTIASNGPYSVEERIKIFKAVAGASRNNANLALQFLRSNTNAVRNMYGGSAKLEEVIFTLAENMVDGDLADNFNRWVFSTTSNLGDSEDIVQRAYLMVREDLLWNERYLETVYEWIDENDATTAALSMFLICLTLALMLFNH